MNVYGVDMGWIWGGYGVQLLELYTYLCGGCCYSLVVGTSNQWPKVKAAFTFKDMEEQVEVFGEE